MRLADGTTVWPRAAKKSRKAARSSSAVRGGTSGGYRRRSRADASLTPAAVRVRRGRLPCRSGAASTSRSASSRRAISSRPVVDARAGPPVGEASRATCPAPGWASPAAPAASRRCPGRTPPTARPRPLEHHVLPVRAPSARRPSRRALSGLRHRTPRRARAAPVTGSSGIRGGSSGTPAARRRPVRGSRPRGAASSRCRSSAGRTSWCNSPRAPAGGVRPRRAGSGSATTRDARRQRGEHGDRQCRGASPRGHRSPPWPRRLPPGPAGPVGPVGLGRPGGSFGATGRRRHRVRWARSSAVRRPRPGGTPGRPSPTGASCGYRYPSP